ncbi:p115 like vesicle tethering protein [Cladochytrium replicatum]|nr:p115 like vesicle tethering protein [Cladochytrium replicatum]
MDYLFSGYNALKGDKGAPQSPTVTIDRLCDRIINSTQLEDRRAGVLGLKGMARDWKKDAGTKGLPALVNVLKTDRMDVDILKAVLDTLTTLCTSDKSDKPKPKSPQKAPIPQSEQTDYGLMFSEIYVKDPGNVTLLLDVLEDMDFYVRFNTIQLLMTLMTNLPVQLQESILTSPLGISRLIDLLDDRREIVRNEALLLLIALTQSNAEIQKIIAFENAFERLLAIVLEEGATDGGIIVQDCLQLIMNLLRYNVSNQNLFRETSCIQKLQLLLKSRIMSDSPKPIEVPLTDESNIWTEQKVGNTIAVLELLRILVGLKNPSTPVNQNVIGQANILSPIIELGLSVRVPAKVRSQALFAAGDIMRGHSASQDLFNKKVIGARPASPSTPAMERQYSRGKPPPVVSKSPPQPAVMAVIHSALASKDFSVRAAAAYTFQCAVHNNADSQLAIASTLTPPPPDNPNSQLEEKPESPGSLLIAALLGAESARVDPYRVWFAAVMLSHILRNNPHTQVIVLEHKFDEEGDDEPISLLHKCMYASLMASREGADIRVQIGFISLVATWLYDCPRAVKEFLSEAANLQFLVEQINQTTGVDPIVQGLAAYVLGICYEFNDDSEPAFTRASMKSLIISRIGVDMFMSKIERLREAPQFTKVSQYMLPTTEAADAPPDVYFDSAFAELFKSTYDSISKSITVVNARTPIKNKSRDQVSDEGQEKNMIQSLKELLARQDREANEMKSRYRDLESKLAAQGSSVDATIGELRSQIAQLQSKLAEQTGRAESLEKEMDDLLVCLAEQDMENRKLKDRLRAHGEVVDSDDEGVENGDEIDGEEGVSGLVGSRQDVSHLL